MNSFTPKTAPPPSTRLCKATFGGSHEMKTKRFTLGFSSLAIMVLAVLSLMSARATELIVNGGLESGSSSWTLSGGVSASTYAGLSHSGSYYLWFGGAVNENDAGYQTITIPANATAATLSFYYNINSDEGTSVAYDTFSATVRNTSGTVLATVLSRSNINKDGGAGNPYYRQSTPFNLLPYAGQTIRIHFSSVNDPSKVTNFRVDDVSVQVTVATVSAPTVQTLAASSVTSSTAQLNGTVNPNGATTTVYFQYGTTTSYGATTGSGNFGSGTTTLSALSNIGPIGPPGTVFHYRIVASNSGGTSYGNDQTFQTTPSQAAPTVQTMAATVVSANSAVINGTITSDGGSAIVERRFDWGTSSGNLNQWTANVTVSGNTFSYNLSGLNSDTLYYFRAWAKNGSSADVGYGAGWNIGTILSFRTSTAQTAPSITTQPVSQSVTAGNPATFTVAASGNPTPSFQWQRSTDGGVNWSNLSNDGTHSGVTTTTLTVNNTTTGMSGYRFRAIASNGVTPNATSSMATLTVNSGQTAPSITTQPVNQTVTAGQNATFTVAASGNPTPSFQWQRSTDGGVNWSNLSNDGTHSGVTTATLTVNSTTTGMSGYRFRTIANNGVTPNATSSAATLTVNGSSGSPLTGKGDWIWTMSGTKTALGVSTVQEVIDYEKARGVQWLVVKCADANNFSGWRDAQFNSDLISRCRAANIKIFGFHFIFGGNPPLGYVNQSTVVGEIQAAKDALALQPDGLVIDWEEDFQGLGSTAGASAAEQYCQAIRVSYPTTFLAHAPIWKPSVNLPNIYRAFGKYCDVAMPQAYSAVGATVSYVRNVSPETMAQDMNTDWKTQYASWPAESIKPILPVVWAAGKNDQAGAYTTDAQVTAFVTALKGISSPAYSGGYQGVSFWSAQHHTALIWNAIELTAIGGSTPSDTTSPTIGAFGATPNSISLGNSFTISYTVSDSGGSGLARVELWLATIDGSSTDSSWTKISTANVSGNGPVSGTLTDTPTVTGTRWYGFHAVDNEGNYKDERQAGVGPIQVTVTLQTAPSITTQPVNQTVTAGNPSNFTVSASGNPTPSYQWQRSTDSGATWSNLSNDGTHSGVTTATLTVNNTTTGMSGYRFRAIASNGVTPNATSSGATLMINPAPPVITSVGTATGTVGQSFSYQITADNNPTSFNATGLPAGLSVNSTSGLISGIPTASGTSTVTLSASNAGGTGTKTLTLTINSAAPVISSTGTATGTINQSFSYQITANNNPTSFNATGLPAGLSVNTTSGLISGTPTASGTSTVTLSASNAGGTGTKTLTLTINSAPPVISSAGTATGTVGQAFSYQIAADNSPTGFNATGLPAGLSVSTASGLISGTPTASGTSTVSLSASNAGGTGTKTLTLTINSAAPVISSAGIATGTVGQSFSYQITADNNPTSFNATGLPAGLSVNTTSGLLSGTPTATGSSTVTLSASNAGGTGTKTLTLTVNTGTGVGFVTRQLPAGYAPGIKFTVTLQATPPAGTQVYAVEDSPPLNWTVSNISHSGSFDGTNRKVKFGPFFDATARTITYDVTPPANETGTKQFAGTGSADGVDSPIGGQSTIDLAPHHPADNNPADYRIVIGEVTAYGAAWKTGQTWPNDPNPIPIGYMTRAGALWKGGEYYTFDPTKTAPLWWVNLNQGGTSQAIKRKQTMVKSAAVSNVSLAARALLARGVTNVPFTVTVFATPSAGVSAWAVEDRPPTGWQVSNITEGGAFDTVNQKVKWGPFFDNTERTLSYDVSPVGTPGNSGVFTGTCSFDGVDKTLAGQGQVTLIEATPISHLGTPAVLPKGEAVLSFLTTPGRTYVLDASTDLATWTPIYTNTAANGSLFFRDSGATNYAGRFYRVREQ